MMALFVAVASSSIVATALPTILADLGGSQADYTWVVTASLLAMTSSTPIWGKLADLYPKKRMVQIALLIFVLGSLLCGAAQSPIWLIACRALQGIGMGGLVSQAQVVVAAVVEPRQRGRWAGIVGSSTTAGTLSGPLLGGLIVDILGWRWCFYVMVPLAAAALVVLQRTLHVPVLPGKRHRIDFPGALLLVGGASALLVWISQVGHQFAWVSWSTLAWVGGGVTAVVVALVVEARAPEPVLPLHVLRDRTVALPIVAALFGGVCVYAASIYVGQYFQLADGRSAATAGLMTMPMVVSTLVASTTAGFLVTRFGRIRPVLLVGLTCCVVGTVAEGLLMRAQAPYQWLLLALVLVGIGLGSTTQNFVLMVQNAVGPEDVGAASATTTFLRSLGGVTGITILGALLGAHVASGIAAGLARIGAPAVGLEDGAIPDLSTLPDAVREVVQASYASGFGLVYLAAAPTAALGLVAVLFVREKRIPERVERTPEELAGRLP
jgi:EmrB/QacA subfamily drug resistance transporter